MKDSTLKKILNICIPFLSIVTIYIIFLILYIAKDNPLSFPSPNTILKEFFILLSKADTYKAILLTLLRLLLCLLISFLIGFILASLSLRSNYLKKYISPFILMFRTIPLVSIIILLIIMFGSKTSLFFIVSLMLIPIMYQNILNGFENVNIEEIEAFSLDSKLNIKILFKIYVPEILGDIKTAFISSIGLGFKVMVMAEFISNAKDSIGYALNSSYHYNVEMAPVYAWTLILVILSIVISKLCELFKNK